jgi:hypothetical protein
MCFAPCAWKALRTLRQIKPALAATSRARRPLLQQSMDLSSRRSAMKDPRFTQASSAFVMTCIVEVNIQADAQVVWSLLTDAKGFARWNSTVTQIEGEIREGERIRLHVPGTSRTFTPTVSGVVPAQRMIWSDGFNPVFKGVRTFELKPGPEGSTDFSMREHFSSFVFALVKGKLPDFRPIFETYAGDLKREAERIARPQVNIQQLRSGGRTFL